MPDILAVSESCVPMLDKLIKILADKIWDKAGYWIVSALGLGANGALHGSLVSDPFYHADWANTQRAWSFFFIILCIGGIALCRTARGFWVTLSASAPCAIGFGIIYNRYEGSWIFLGWLLHGIVLALLVGMIAFLLESVIERTKQRPRKRVTRPRQAKSASKSAKAE